MMSADSKPANNRRDFLKGMALGSAAVAGAAAGAFGSPAFLTADNLIGIVRQVALIGIMATCTTF